MDNNSSVDNLSVTNTYKDFAYQIKIGTLSIFQDPLPHEFFSKINILENFKGNVYRHQKLNGSFSSSKFTEVDNRIAYIPFGLKNVIAPSGCINTSTNQLSLVLSKDSNASGDITDKDIDIYIVYHTIYILSDSK